MTSQVIDCIGDSFTIGSAGYDDTACTTPLTPYPTQLSQLLDLPVLNVGVGGTGLSTIKTSFLTQAADKDIRSAVVICGGGTNDKDETVSATLGGYVTEMLAVLSRSPARFVLWGPFAATDYTVQQKANIESHRAYFAANFASYYLDMTDFNVTANIVDESYRRYNTAGVRDTLHPNSAWYAELASRIKTRITSTNSWITPAELRSLNFAPVAGTLALAFIDGASSRSVASTYAALDATNQGYLDAAKAHALTKIAGGETLVGLAITGRIVSGVRSFTAQADFTSSFGRRRLPITDFSSGVQANLNTLFAALEAF